MGSSQALALVLQLGTIDKKIKKLNQIWAKFKATPTSIILLLKDLTILISTVIAVAVDNGPSRDHPVIVTALNELSNTLQHLQDLSGKYTSRFGRKPLTSDNLHQFELCLTDGKIRLLLIQFLLERREATPSRAVVAEELAQLYVKPLSRVSLDRSKSGTVEPKADSLLSFKCYSELIGREKVLLQLDAEFRDSNVVALIGPGGIGKTQIATEYTVRIQERQAGCHILWVDCESPTSLEASYRTIAETLQVQGWDDPRTDILEKTRNHLNQTYSVKWFMVLQNVSRSSLKWETTTGLTTIDPSHFPLSLATYLPKSSRGQMLCISCEAGVVQQLPGNCTIFDIDPLHDTEAALLFSSKVPKEMDASPGIPALTEALDYTPLAICQAAAYMVATRCDSPRYLELLESNKSYKLSESCHKTTSISFNSIQKQNTRAADLLSLMAVTYRRNISKTVLWHAWKYGLSDLVNQANLPDLDTSDNKVASPDTVADNDKADYVEFATALATLEAYLLVQYDARNETYSLHRIVQSAVLSILQQQDTISIWRSSAIVLLSAFSHVCRSVTKANPQVSLSNMVLHISEVVQEAPIGICAGLAKAKILCDMAALKMSLMQPKAASPLLQEAYTIQKSLLKPQDPRLLKTLLALAESTVYSDSPAAAIPFFIQAIAGHKQMLGPGNRRTLFAQVNLCSNYVVIGDVDAAIPVHYETQAAVSASLQISTDDRRRLQQRLNELKGLIALAQQRQGKLLKLNKSASSEDLQSKNRLSALRQDRKRVSGVRAFSANSRVASLDSIVEMFEV